MGPIGNDLIIQPNPEELHVLQALALRLREPLSPVSLKIDKRDHPLTPAVVHLLRLALEYLGRDLAVAVEPYGPVLTTQADADLLHVSRPYVISLIDAGPIRPVKLHAG